MQEGQRPQHLRKREKASMFHGGTDRQSLRLGCAGPPASAAPAWMSTWWDTGDDKRLGKEGGRGDTFVLGPGCAGNASKSST